MTWIRDMERDAVAVAFTDWEWRDDDVVTIDQRWEDAGGYSEYTQWDANFEITVEVRRAEYTDDYPALGYRPDLKQRTSYTRDDAANFWAELMKKGSSDVRA